MNIFHNFALWVRFFLLHMYTRTRGRPIGGGYVCSRGCLSNLMLLIEDFCFIYKTSLESQQEFHLQKIYLKALHCDRDFTSILVWKFSPEMRSWSLTKVLCYKFTSYFLECCYWPGGSSLHIQDGDISKYVLYVSHIKKSGLFLTSTMQKLKTVFIRLECFL